MASKKQPPKPRAEDGIAAGSQQPAVPTPFPTTATKEGRKDAGNLDTVDGSGATPQITQSAGNTETGDSTPFPTTGTRKGRKGCNTTDRTTAGNTQITNPKPENETGDVAACSAVAESPVVFTVLEQPLNAHARIGESPRNCWERLRKEARAAGLPKGQGPGSAYEWATRETDRLFPPKEPTQEPEAEPEPEIIEEPEAVAIPDPIEPEEPPPTPIPSDQGVPGLGTIPEGWPKLAANASLQAEIAWVSANRLLVRDGSGVDLSKSLSHAPSYSALSWLETSILFPSKFADISVKATQNQEDEAQHVRREKLAIEEIRALLAEMMED